MASNDVMIKVVGDRFCLPYTTELFVKEKIQSPYSSHYDVFDSTGNTLLRVDGGARNLKRRRVMSDPAGFPVITIREQGNGKLQNPISWKQEWRIHEGESSDSNHFLFRVKRSSGSHFRDLDVYLGSRDDRGAGDFHVTRGIGFASLSCKVRRGNSIIAE
ncbi:protein LURP-one-related 14-like, partial [Hibiscus syriacus]